MDFWTPEQIAKFIPIKDAFEEFCEADPKLSKLDSTKPDPKCDREEFDKWYARYCPLLDTAARHFAGLFRDKVLVERGVSLHDDKEIVLSPELWAITKDVSLRREDREERKTKQRKSKYEKSKTKRSVEHSPGEGEGFASLMVMKEMVQGKSTDDPKWHLKNYNAVLRREDWEEWKAKQRKSNYEKSKAKRKRDVVADKVLEIRIKKVLKKARTKWPDPKKRREIDVMAKELERLDREPKLPHNERHGYKFETIRKILKGTYETSMRLEIAGL